MKTYPLLKKAPKDHNSPEFLDFLRENNKVFKETDYWLIIENCKYHTKKTIWLTAFFKNTHQLPLEPVRSYNAISALNDLYFDFYDWEWLKKAKSKQTVKRFHIHLIKK